MATCIYCGEDKDEGGVYSAGGFSCYAEGCWARFVADSAERTRQEIAGLIAQGLCYFDRAWIGRCKKPGTPMCTEHAGKACASCGSPATHDCGETGQFVCGAPLCDECEHTTFPNGTNGGVGFNAQSPPEGMRSHCRKSEQRYQPWYARERESAVSGHNSDSERESCAALK